jgi:hypothetical protein
MHCSVTMAEGGDRRCIERLGSGRALVVLSKFEGTTVVCLPEERSSTLLTRVKFTRQPERLRSAVRLPAYQGPPPAKNCRKLKPASKHGSSRPVHA